jgi:hypothetical protein
MLEAAAAGRENCAGERAAARESYLEAASRTSNLPQQRYLHARAARLVGEE